MKQPLYFDQSRQGSASLGLIPASYKGLNFSDPPIDLDAGEALVLDNLIARPGYAEPRKGWSSVVVRATANKRILSMLTYGTSFFYVTDIGIYNTSDTLVWDGTGYTTMTNGFVESVGVVGAAGLVTLFCCNGQTTSFHYNGSWGADTWTGVDLKTLCFVTTHYRRVWYVVNNSTSGWYGAADAVSGALTEFNIGPLLKLGGTLFRIDSVTVDAGAGLQDFLAFTTTAGEIVIYEGSDPSAAATWALRGVFTTGRPVNRRTFLKYKGDLLILTEDGLFSLSQAIQGREDKAKSISYKIDPALRDDITNYTANDGWFLLHLPEQNIILLNVPESATVSHQWVLELSSKAWSRWTGLNMDCMAVGPTYTYFGSKTKDASDYHYVGKFWDTNQDRGTAIEWIMRTSFQKIGKAGSKSKIQLVRPMIRGPSTFTFYLKIDTDFEPRQSVSTHAWGGFSPSSLGTDETGDSIWGGNYEVDTRWRSVFSRPGSFHSIRLRGNANVGAPQLMGFQISYVQTGI